MHDIIFIALIYIGVTIGIIGWLYERKRFFVLGGVIGLIAVFFFILCKAFL